MLEGISRYMHVQTLIKYLFMQNDGWVREKMVYNSDRNCNEKKKHYKNANAMSVVTQLTEFFSYLPMHVFLPFNISTEKGKCLITIKKSHYFPKIDDLNCDKREEFH